MPVITASDFINFITDTVLPDKTIGKHLDAALRDNAEQFRTLADRTRLTTAISVDEMAELFGIDRERVEKLYLYYTIQNGVADSGTVARCRSLWIMCSIPWRQTKPTARW